MRPPRPHDELPAAVEVHGMTLQAVFVAAAVAALTGLASGPVLRRLPEPAAPGPGPNGKLPYAALADRRFAAGTALLALALGLVSWTALPPSLQTPWIVLASFGVLLAMIDLRTTWLPLVLTRSAWLAMAVAVAVSAALAADAWLLVRGAAGAAAAGGLYWLAWALTRGGYGFGDVRFAPLIGAAAATVSWSTCARALLMGTVVGGVVGLARLLRGRRGSFPYAPAMLVGCYLGLVWTLAA